MLYITLHIQNHDNMIINVVIPLYEVPTCSYVYEIQNFTFLEVIMHDKVAEANACSDLMNKQSSNIF